ncbi:ubiquitin-like-specific protease ESD4 isoform X2 [Corylus avellana]|uniref:ubiquitin-like-specific protease ESD4 isoform X2 n=1 Tax=Corylus avellana TaxID=13451 RepID=UPI00286B6FA2|nr:ubiquitin-like-specific protease ESD4 isoform X2 [Corylus avellana]
MGARTSNRKRGDECLSFNHTYPSQNSSDFHVSKRPRFSSMHQNPDRTVVSSNSTVARLSRYPEATPRLGREVHAPCRILNYGFSSTSLNQKSGPRTSGVCEKEKPIDEMGNILSYKYNNAKNSALRAIRHLTKGKEKEEEVIDVDTDNEKGSGGGGVSEDSSIEEVEVVNGVVVNVQELDAKTMDRGLFPSSSSAVSDLTNGNLRVDNEEKMLDSLSLNHERDLSSVSAYKKLLESVEKRTSKLRNLSFEIEVNEKRRSIFQLLRPAAKPVEKVPREPFVHLTKEEEADVERAFNSNKRKVLATHENSNIEITGGILQCLRPGAWLNDEVINVYLELLKERENREPQKFLKCHFFNTFFYKKLISGKNGYDYKSVKRWTSQRKLGYSLIECDKIFVPIHKEIHWCLAVINKKDEKFQYLDSLGGMDTQVLKVLGHMSYFRQRTAMEILRLKAN